MTLTIGQLAADSIFTYDSREWKKGGMRWGAPRFAKDGVKEENIGSAHTKCTPKFGGQFQDALAIFLPDETAVFIK